MADGDDLIWHPMGEGQPEQAVAGDLTIFRFEDGSAFASLDAVL
jgi:hypothetical protein